MGAPIALRGVRVLYGDDGGRRNSALGRRIALMATTTTNGGALRMRVYGLRVRTHREPPPTEQAFLHFSRRDDVRKRYEAVRGQR